MDGIDKLLDPEDIFSSVKVYQLNRNDHRVFIYVHEILAGEGKGLFIAYPTLILGESKEQYMCTGTSPKEALKKCLASIKGVANTRDLMQIET